MVPFLPRTSLQTFTQSQSPAAPKRFGLAKREISARDHCYVVHFHRVAPGALVAAKPVAEHIPDGKGIFRHGQAVVIAVEVGPELVQIPIAVRDELAPVARHGVYVDAPSCARATGCYGNL